LLEYGKELSLFVKINSKISILKTKFPKRILNMSAISLARGVLEHVRTGWPLFEVR